MLVKGRGRSRGSRGTDAKMEQECSDWGGWKGEPWGSKLRNRSAGLNSGTDALERIVVIPVQCETWAVGIPGSYGTLDRDL